MEAVEVFLWGCVILSIVTASASVSVVFIMAFGETKTQAQTQLQHLDDICKTAQKVKRTTQ